VVEDDSGHYAPAQAQFSFQTEAAAVDRFVERLRVVEREQYGSAPLLGTEPLA
jgi:hypothetical protein